MASRYIEETPWGSDLGFTPNGWGLSKLSIKSDSASQPFTYQFMMMKINTKITNMQIMTPMVSTKTRTASVSGLIVLLICSSGSRETHMSAARNQQEMAI